MPSRRPTASCSRATCSARTRWTAARRSSEPCPRSPISSNSSASRSAASTVVESKRFATVAIVGLPNAGKSTLLNTLLGQRLAATSQTPQTTRTRVLGVVERGPVQLAFLDTPGVHKPQHALNERMMGHVDAALGEADILLWVVD